MVKICCIIFSNINRREVNSSSKPFRLSKLEISYIHMNNRYHRTFRMDDERNSACKKIGPFFGKKFGSFSEHFRKIYSAFFKYIPVLNYTGSSASASFTLP